MDNMLDISREAFPRPAVSRLSSVLHETEAATQRGIDRAFPVSLTGLAEHAKRQHNAEDMLGHFRKGDYPHLAPMEVTPLVTDPLRTAQFAASGEGFLSHIFGEKLDEVVDLVARQAGVSRTSAHVILGLSAPLLLDAVGKETVLRKFDAGELTQFLDVQEENARGVLPVVVERASQAVATSGIDTVAQPISPPLKTLHGYAPPHLTPANEVSPTSETRRHGSSLTGAPEAPSNMLRTAIYLIAMLGALAFLGWLAFRSLPQPEPVPARPSNLGKTEQPVAPKTPESMPGGVPAIGAENRALNNTPGTEASSSSAPLTPNAAVEGTREPAETGGEKAPETALVPSREAASETAPALAPRREAPTEPERLSGQEAVDAIGPVVRADEGQAPASELPAVPPSTSESQLAFGAIPQTPSAAIDEGDAPRGIAESIPTQTPPAAPEQAMANYLERGARPPQRFVVTEREFTRNSATLSGNTAQLQDAAQILRAHPSSVVLVEAFADDADTQRPELSRARAEAVGRFLLANGATEAQVRLAEHAPAEAPNDGQVNLVLLTR